MYSGLLPKGLTEAELSSDGEDGRDAQEEERESKSEGSPEKLSGVGGNSGSVVEGDPSHTPNDKDSESPRCSLPGISQEMWQKFQDLQKRKNEIKTMKDPRRRKRRRHKKGTDTQESAEEREREAEREKHWDGLKQYFGVNDRFHPPACSKPPPKSGLEKSIESAIAEGDIAKAEEMSDRLATRELAVKVTQAASCRDFVQCKQEEEASRAAQKRKKQIAWGFEAKKRWETKSNMGFM
uniref:Family with sequence similarity 204 member A n=2 Tax=Myripristis murdjan TaxID=586833 RepID=A0A667YB91_9TELE